MTAVAQTLHGIDPAERICSANGAEKIDRYICKAVQPCKKVVPLNGGSRVLVNGVIPLFGFVPLFIECADDADIGDILLLEIP